MDPSVIAAVLALLGSEIVQGPAAVATLVSALGQFGQWYDEALLLGRQWERNLAALEHYAGGEERAEGIIARMQTSTKSTIDEVALAGMATEAMMRGVTRNPVQIAELAEVAWARGGVSLAGTPESSAERTAKVFEDLLDAITRQDVTSLMSWGFAVDERRLQGLTGRALQNELLEQVLNDKVAKELGTLDAFETSLYEKNAAETTTNTAVWGHLASIYSAGFWKDLENPSMAALRGIYGLGNELAEDLGKQLAEAPAKEAASVPELRPAPTPPTATPMPTGTPTPTPAATWTGTPMAAMTPTPWTPVPPHPPTPEAVLSDEGLALRWGEATDGVVSGILQRVEADIQAGITPELVRDLALRLFPDGLPGQRRPTAYGGVLSEKQARGMG